MTIRALDANAAYGATAGRVGKGGGLPSAEVDLPRAQGGGFAELLSNSLSGLTEAGHKSEVVSAQAVAGQANLVDLVTAVNDAELALDTVVAIRDKVISAYQDIMRMPI